MLAQTHRIIPSQPILKFNRLLQTPKPPIALLVLQSRYTQELLDRLFRLLGFHLFGVVVFVLHVHVAVLFGVIVVFVFEIVAKS